MEDCGSAVESGGCWNLGMVMVVGTVQTGNPVGQPQIIPIPGDLQHNRETRCLCKKLRVQNYLQMLGAVSAVQQVWYNIR